MISVISSYSLCTTTNGILPNLEHTCEQLRSRGFSAVDVLLSESDIGQAATAANGERRLPDLPDSPEIVDRAARAIAHEVDRATAGTGVPLLVPAFATNFPNISSLEKDLFGKAVGKLAVSLVAADILNVSVVEAVCGRRIKTDRGTREETRVATNPAPGKAVTAAERITSPTNDAIIKEKRKRLVDGVKGSYALARETLGRWPKVGLALEMEPGFLSLVRSVRDVITLVEEIRQSVKLDADIAKKDEERDALEQSFGVNLDWGHLLAWLDREAPLKRDKAKQNALDMLSDPKYRGWVFHAHVSQTTPRAPTGKMLPWAGFVNSPHTKRSSSSTPA